MAVDLVADSPRFHHISYFLANGFCHKSVGKTLAVSVQRAAKKFCLKGTYIFCYTYSSNTYLKTRSKLIPILHSTIQHSTIQCHACLVNNFRSQSVKTVCACYYEKNKLTMIHKTNCKYKHLQLRLDFIVIFAADRISNACNSFLKTYKSVLMPYHQNQVESTHTQSRNQYSKVGRLSNYVATSQQPN